MYENAPFMLLSQTKVSYGSPTNISGVGVSLPSTDAISPVALHAGALEGSSCPFRTAMTILRKPSLQLILAATVALAAGLFAWYYM